MRGVPVEMRTGPDPASGIGPARRLLTDTVARWGCPSVDDIALVVSELITNAVKHTAGAAAATIFHECAGVVRVEVHDSSHAIPRVRRAAPPMASGGYGLRIVAELSESWGWEQTDTGKSVWSVVACGH